MNLVTFQILFKIFYKINNPENVYKNPKHFLILTNINLFFLLFFIINPYNKFKINLFIHLFQIIHHL